MPDNARFLQRLFQVSSFLTVIFPVLLLSNVISDIAICVIAISFLAHSHLRRQWDWLKEGWVQALLALWLYMCLRGLCSPLPKEALSRALPFIRYVIFAAALARWTLADSAARQRFYRVLSAAVVLLAADGLVQYVAGRDLLWHRLIHDPNNGHIRLDGAFSRPILGIMLAWLAFPALLPVVFDMSGALRRGAGLPRACACMLIVLAAIALSGERVALMLTFAGFALAILLLRLRLRLVLISAAGLVLMIGVLALLSPDMASRQLTSTAETLRHWQQSPYGLLFESDMTVARIHPVIGVGANQFRNNCEALYPGDPAKIAGMCNTHPHNTYLEWLIEEGIIGCALFCLSMLLIVNQSVNAFMRGARNPAFAGLFIAFVLRVWPLMPMTGFFSRWGAPPFWLVLGALLVYTAGKGKTHAGTPLAVQDAGL